MAGDQVYLPLADELSSTYEISENFLKKAFTIIPVGSTYASSFLSEDDCEIGSTSACLAISHLAYAYEYTLQFSSPGGARGLTVAGYEFIAGTVAGNCSYYISRSSGGRGSHPVTVYYYNSCTWDLFGNLLSISPQSRAPVAPVPISRTGTEVVYAIQGKSTTGSDTRGFGFVNTPSSHFLWQASGSYAVIPWAAYTITATLTSDGDFPLKYLGADVVTGISGTITPSPGKATMVSTTCPASVAVGASCSVKLSYNPTTIACTPSPYGYAYTNLTLSLMTDAGANPDFTEGFTVTGVPICDD